jgi:hypothetical protein
MLGVPQCVEGLEKRDRMDRMMSKARLLVGERRLSSLFRIPSLCPQPGSGYVAIDGGKNGKKQQKRGFGLGLFHHMRSMVILLAFNHNNNAADVSLSVSVYTARLHLTLHLYSILHL